MTSTFSNQVVIGPEFFAKARNDYRDWRWAIAREFLQNCLDAPGCRNVAVTVEQGAEPGTVLLRVANDGAPMSREILVGKLLSLGSSGKNFSDGTGAGSAVGGFGKAKEILYFCHQRYVIRTGNLVVEGSGAGYNLTETSTPYAGTISEVVLADADGWLRQRLEEAFRRFVGLSQWRGTVTINGKVEEQRLLKGQGRRDLEGPGDGGKEQTFGRVYTNNNRSNLIVIRINGMPMFTRTCDYRGCVVLELDGASSGVLQSSRDSLKYDYGTALDRFLTDLTTNRRRALSPRAPSKLTYAGYLLRGRPRIAPAPAANATAEVGGAKATSKGDPYATAEGEGSTASGGAGGSGTVKLEGSVTLLLGSGSVPSSQEPSAVSAARCATEPVEEESPPTPQHPMLIVKNETEYKVPTKYTPEGLTSYSRRLLNVWCESLQLIADLTGYVKPFAVGLVLNTESLGMYEGDRDGGVIYINPAKVNEEARSKFEDRWSFSGRSGWSLICTAVHEWVHHMGFGPHDEDYANQLTTVMEIVLMNAPAFQSILRGADYGPFAEEE